MSRHLARFRISAETLRKALGMPDGANIFRVDVDEKRFYPETYILYVEHPDLYLVNKGDVIPFIKPTINIPEFDWGMDGVTISYD